MRVRRKRRKVFFPLLVIGIIIVIILFLFIVKNEFLNIKSVEIVDNNLDCVNQAFIKEESRFIGKNLFNVETKNTETKIKNKFLCIKDISFSKVLPNKLRMHITTRKPLLRVIKFQEMEASTSSILENISTPSAQQSVESYFMDDEGILFAKSLDDLDIPNIFVIDKNITLGRKISGINIESVIKILNNLRVFGVDTKTILISGNDLVIYSVPKIIFSLKNEIDLQIASLQLILERSKIDSSKVEFIDLRFDKPIIKIAPKKNG